MKAKNFYVIRPKLSYKVANLWGWFVFPFIVLRVFAKCCRLRNADITMAGKKIFSIRMLVIPKFKRVDAL